MKPGFKRVKETVCPVFVFGITVSQGITPLIAWGALSVRGSRATKPQKNKAFFTFKI